MSPRISQNPFSVRTFRAALALTTLALLAVAAPASHAQHYYDTDGETIGLVGGESSIGTVNKKPFTVYTNAQRAPTDLLARTTRAPSK